VRYQTQRPPPLLRICGAVQRMAQLSDALLSLARITRTEFQREDLDLSAMATAIAADLRREEPTRQVAFVIADGLHATGDPRLLRIALENLLGNAWKLTAKRPQACVEVGGLAQEDGPPAFFVRDDGAGFDMIRADKLFGPFQRLHREGEFPGTGIGLAMVQRIIQRHGGRIWAEGAVDHGPRFTSPCNEKVGKPRQHGLEIETIRSSRQSSSGPEHSAAAPERCQARLLPLQSAKKDQAYLSRHEGGVSAGAGSFGTAPPTMT
jgi:light-regulated signal transduction histidine kinase (bacteriophytochrome)